jgi:cytochrome c
MICYKLITKKFHRALWTAIFIGAAFGGASAQVSPSVQRGTTFAQTNCARCHSIDKVSPSPLSLAPPFRILHLRYPVENLSSALGEGIVTGHPTMPEFRLDPGEVHDFIDFLKSLEP